VTILISHLILRPPSLSLRTRDARVRAVSVSSSFLSISRRETRQRQSARIKAASPKVNPKREVREATESKARLRRSRSAIGSARNSDPGALSRDYLITLARGCTFGRRHQQRDTTDRSHSRTPRTRARSRSGLGIKTGERLGDSHATCAHAAQRLQRRGELRKERKKERKERGEKRERDIDVRLAARVQSLAARSMRGRARGSIIALATRGITACPNSGSTMSASRSA